MRNIRILVADNHEIVRLGVRSILSFNPAWEVCGEAADAQELLGEVAQLSPDIVITELAISGSNGLNAIREILRRVPDQKILVLTYCDSELLAHHAIEAGVRGLLLKSDAAVELCAAIHALATGALYFTRRVSGMLLQGFRWITRPKSEYVRCCWILTGREEEMLKAVAYGLSNRKISETFGLTKKTVESHRVKIMRKLDLHSVSDVVLYALRNNLLSIDNREIGVYSAATRSLNTAGRNKIAPREEDDDRQGYAVPAASSVGAA